MQALTVPIQGFLNALAYGWTRGDFRSVMSLRRNNNNNSLTISHQEKGSSCEDEEANERDEVTDEGNDREEWKGEEYAAVFQYSSLKDS